MTIGKDILPPDDQPPTWFETWTHKFETRIDNKLSELKSKISCRLDNIVAKNNLIE